MNFNNAAVKDPPDCDVKEVKEPDIPASGFDGGHGPVQALPVDAQQLDDGETLTDYHIQQASTLHMVRHGNTNGDTDSVAAENLAAEEMIVPPPASSSKLNIAHMGIDGLREFLGGYRSLTITHLAMQPKLLAAARAEFEAFDAWRFNRPGAKAETVRKRVRALDCTILPLLECAQLG